MHFYNNHSIMSSKFCSVSNSVPSRIYSNIGGIASQYWGRVRSTLDVDIKVLVPQTDYSKAREVSGGSSHNS